MTAETGIADLIVEVNDEKLFYRQGTLEYSPGLPEAKVEGLATGGSTAILATEDVSTAFGVVKFTLPLTETTAAQAREWKENGLNANIVRLSGRDSFVLLNATLMNKNEFKVGVDSEIAIEFNGSAENS